MKYVLYIYSLFITTSILGQMNYKPSDTINIDGVNINYAMVGSGTENLVFLHGFALSTESWSFIKDRFDTTKYKLLFIDLKGFGFSSKPKKSDYSIEEQSKIVYGVLRTLELNNVTLISHSYGGIVALNLTYQSLTHEIALAIKREIFIDVPGFIDIKPKFINILKNNFLSFISLKIVPARILAKYTLRTTFYDYKRAKKNHLRRYTYFYKQKNTDESMVQAAKNIIPIKMNEIMNSYKRIDFPVLIIWGENDYLIKLEHGKRLNKEIKNSEFISIPNCGHVPQEECPNETIVEMLKFLDKK